MRPRQQAPTTTWANCCAACCAALLPARSWHPALLRMRGVDVGRPVSYASPPPPGPPRPCVQPPAPASPSSC